MKDIVRKLSLIVLAISLLGISINLFLAPHHIAAGGVSGIGILVEQVTGIDRALTVLILNGFMLVLTFFFLGKQIFVNTIIGSILFPIVLAITPDFMATEDRLLSVIIGSSIFAVGVATLYKIGASSGGTTIPPLILKKYVGLSTSIGLLATDAVIVLFSIYVFGFEEFLYAILSIAITSIVMTYIETGLKRRKAVMIMSDSHTEQIKNALPERVNRGVTAFSVSGGYTGREKDMLLIILNNHEYPTVINSVNQVDKNAFVIAYNVSEVHGLGFTYHPLE